MTPPHEAGGRSALQLDLPAPPAALARMTALLAQPSCDLETLSDLIESDMALASALIKTVNSALFKLVGRIQTVREAIAYLGFRQVAGITLQQGLRSAFPHCPELDRLWERAARRSELMGLLGQSLGFDAWAAHSAGLFEECGQALLFRHAPVQYRRLWARAGSDDRSLIALEMHTFGASHDIVGAALCETWGLQPSAVHSVRHHVELRGALALPGKAEHRSICALSVLAHCVMNAPADLERCLLIMAPQLGMDPARIRAVIPA